MAVSKDPVGKRRPLTPGEIAAGGPGSGGGVPGRVDVGVVGENAAGLAGRPKRPGRSNGQVVRNGGFVWQWNRDRAEWSRLREVRPRDRKDIPTASKALDRPEGQDGKERPAPVESAEGAAAPAPIAPSGGGGGRGKTKPAADGGKPLDELVGVPGGGEYVKVGKQHWVFYDVPGRDTVMAWQIRGEGELDRITGNGQVKPNRSITPQQFKKRGVINFGYARELANTDQHPFWQWLPRYKEEAKVKPWLLDPEMFAVHAASWLENGTDPTMAQIQGTKWWRTHTESERRMVELAASDPDTFEKLKADTPRRVEEALIAAGFDFTEKNRDRITGYYTRELMAGRMTVEDFEAEAERVANPYKTGADPTAGLDALPEGAEVVRHKGRTYLRMNGKDFALAKGFETAKYGAGAKRVDEVNVAGRPAREVLAKRGAPPQGRDSVKGLEETRALIQDWLGPLLARQWSERDIAVEAQKMTENPEHRNELVTRLRALRASVYKGYDPELQYKDIAAVGRSQFQQQWGQLPDETDPLFQQVLQMNDVGQASQLLWDKGLERGVRKVTYDALQGLDQGLGGSVVRSAV